MNQYIEANRKSWRTIAEDHYKTCRGILSREESTLSGVQHEELGDVAGKKLIHLQCNTGADTISLARMGASVVGWTFPELKGKLPFTFSLKATVR